MHALLQRLDICLLISNQYYWNSWNLEVYLKEEEEDYAYPIQKPINNSQIIDISI